MAKAPDTTRNVHQSGLASAAQASSQVVSRQRVVDHGEVLTSDRDVNAMLDLVADETQRIDSRFLEPACGTGNFLHEILNRKLRVIEERYRKTQASWEQNTLIAIGSMYGIDILEDNVTACRTRLLVRTVDEYRRLFKAKVRGEVIDGVKVMLSHNIVHGDALTLTSGAGEPIVFSEWTMPRNGQIKRRDYAFHELLEPQGFMRTPKMSDQGQAVFLPETVREFPAIHYLELGRADCR